MKPRDRRQKTTRERPVPFCFDAPAADPRRRGFGRERGVPPEPPGGAATAFDSDDDDDGGSGRARQFSYPYFVEEDLGGAEPARLPWRGRFCRNVNNDSNNFIEFWPSEASSEIFSGQRHWLKPSVRRSSPDSKPSYGCDLPLQMARLSRLFGAFPGRQKRLSDPRVERYTAYGGSQSLSSTVKETLRSEDPSGPDWNHRRPRGPSAIGTERSAGRTDVRNCQIQTSSSIDCWRSAAEEESKERRARTVRTKEGAGSRSNPRRAQARAKLFRSVPCSKIGPLLPAAGKKRSHPDVGGVGVVGLRRSSSLVVAKFTLCDGDKGVFVPFSWLHRIKREEVKLKIIRNEPSKIPRPVAAAPGKYYRPRHSTLLCKIDRPRCRFSGTDVAVRDGGDL